MSILVTGGAGFIGSHTVVELCQAGYDVVIVDNFSNSNPKVIQRIEQIVNRELQVYEVDISNKEAMSQIFEQHEIEAVIHFAAYKAVGESVAEPLKYYDNNVAGTIALLEVMTEFQVKRIVFSSSATVYGTHNQSPLKETMPTYEATNPYGYSKIINEQILKDVAYANDNWGLVILRYFNPIGAHASGLIGEDAKGTPNNLMPYITKVAIKELESLTIFGDDYDTKDGTGIRDYIHVVDLAQGHVKALDKALKEEGTYIYNLGTGDGYSVLDLVHAFEKATSSEVPYRIGARRAGDVAEVYADPTLAEQELGWKAKRDLLTMCQDSWNWQKLNPNGFN